MSNLTLTSTLLPRQSRDALIKRAKQLREKMPQHRADGNVKSEQFARKELATVRAQLGLNVDGTRPAKPPRTNREETTVSLPWLGDINVRKNSTGLEVDLPFVGRISGRSPEEVKTKAHLAANEFRRKAEAGDPPTKATTGLRLDEAFNVDTRHHRTVDTSKALVRMAEDSRAQRFSKALGNSDPRLRAYALRQAQQAMGLGTLDIAGYGKVAWTSKGPGMEAYLPGIGAVRSASHKGLLDQIQRKLAAKAEQDYQAYLTYCDPKRQGTEEDDQRMYTNYGQLPTVEQKAKAKAAQARQTARDITNQSLPLLFMKHGVREFPGMLLSGLVELGGNSKDPNIGAKVRAEARNSPLIQGLANFAPGFGQVKSLTDGIEGTVRSIEAFGKGDPSRAGQEILYNAGLPLLFKGLGKGASAMQKSWNRLQETGDTKTFIREAMKHGLSEDAARSIVRDHGGKRKGRLQDQKNYVPPATDKAGNRVPRRRTIGPDGNEILHERGNIQSTGKVPGVQGLRQVAKDLESGFFEKRRAEFYGTTALIDGLDPEKIKDLTVRVVDKLTAKVKGKKGSKAFHGLYNPVDDQLLNGPSVRVGTGALDEEGITFTQVLAHEISHHLEESLTRDQLKKLEDLYEGAKKSHNLQNEIRDRMGLKEKPLPYRLSSYSEYWAHVAEDYEQLNSFLRNAHKAEDVMAMKALVKLRYYANWLRYQVQALLHARQMSAAGIYKKVKDNK